MALIDLNVTLRLSPDISAALAAIQKGVAAMQQEVADIKKAVADVKAAVDQFPAAVDAFEARITDLINNSGMSQEDKDELAAATAELKSTLATAAAALTDAADGTDEAAGTPTP